MNILSEHSSKVEKGKSGKQNLKGETNWRVNESDKQDGPKPTHFFFFSNSIQIVNGSNYRFCVPHSTTFHFHSFNLSFIMCGWFWSVHELIGNIECIQQLSAHRIQFRSVQSTFSDHRSLSVVTIAIMLFISLHILLLSYTRFQCFTFLFIFQFDSSKWNHACLSYVMFNVQLIIRGPHSPFHLKPGRSLVLRCVLCSKYYYMIVLIDR